MTAETSYAAIVREARLANTGQPCGDGFIAGGLQCHVGPGDAQRSGRRTPERQARMRELQLQIKRERNLPPNAAAGLTPEQLHHVRRLATRRETDENTRRQAAGQAQRPAVQRPEPAQPTQPVRAEASQQPPSLAALQAQRDAENAAAREAGRESAARLEARRQAIEITERAAREADARVAAAAGAPVVATGSPEQQAVAERVRENLRAAVSVPAAAVVAAAQPESRPVEFPEAPARYSSQDIQQRFPTSSAAVAAILPLARAGNYNAISDLQLDPEVNADVRVWRQSVIDQLRANDVLRQLRIGGLPPAPIFEAASAPNSLAHVRAVQAAVATGNVAAVRAIEPSNEVNSEARRWQDQVVAAMERQQMEAAVAAAPPVQAMPPHIPLPPVGIDASLWAGTPDFIAQVEGHARNGNLAGAGAVPTGSSVHPRADRWRAEVVRSMEEQRLAHPDAAAPAQAAAPAPAAAAAPHSIPPPPVGWENGSNSASFVPQLQAAIAANDLVSARALSSSGTFDSVQDWHREVIQHMEQNQGAARQPVAPPPPPAAYAEANVRANNPVSARTVDAIQAAMLSGNVQAVRDVPSDNANRDVQEWQRAVIAHMEARNAQSVRPFATPPVAPVAPVVPQNFPREPYIDPNHAGAMRHLGALRAAIASGSPARIRRVPMIGSDASRGQYARLRRYQQQVIAHLDRGGALPPAQAPAASPASPAAASPAAPQAIPVGMPTAPPIPTDRAYPITTAFVTGVNAAIATGNLEAVREQGRAHGEPLSQHREWHNQVVAHMEQAAREAAMTPEARARAAAAAEAERIREAELQAKLNQVHPVVIPPPRILSTEEQSNIDRIAEERRALDSRVTAKREAAAAAERDAMARHAPAVTAAEAATREAAAALERANAAHRAALQARGDEVNPAREARQRAEDLRTRETRRLEREAAAAAVGKHRPTLTAADGKVIYQPSDFVPANTPGHNANYVQDNSVAINAGRLATTFGVPQAEVVEKVKNTVLSMMSDLPEKVGSHTSKWTVAVKADSSGGLDVSFNHPGIASAISRTFSNGPNGLQVYHGYFRVGDSRGEGISQKLFRQSIGAYERAGVKEIKVYAALSHGGYVWLRHGFVPDPGDDDSYRSIARSTLERLRTQGANLKTDSRHTKPDTAEKVAKVDADEKTGVLTKEAAKQKRNSLINADAIYNFKTDKVPLPGTKISQEAYEAYMKLVDSGDPRDLIRLAAIKYGDIKIGAEMFVGQTYHGTIRMGTGDLDRTKEYIMRNRKPV